MTKLTKEDARKTWEAAAPGWTSWEDVFASGFRDATEQMLDIASVSAGSRVLDLACGAGSQTFQAAERVGNDGTVVASDISATMLSHVRATARERGVTNVETLESAAEDLDASRSFDAAICRLGLMLFPDPKGAAGAVLRALKPGGVFAPLVFTTPQRNPFMSGPLGILFRHAGRDLPPPGQPGIFALGVDGALEGILSESGFADVRAKKVSVTLRLESADAALEMMQAAFGVYRAAVADLGDAGRDAAWLEVREFLGQFDTDSGWRTELEVVIGAGTAPP